MGMSPFELAIPFLFMEQSFIGKGMTKTQSVFLSLDIRSIHFGVHLGRSNAICVECWTKNSIPQYWFSRGQANNHLAGFFVVVPITPLTVRPEDWVKLLLGETTGQELPVSGRKWDLNPISFMIAALVQSVCM